MKGIAHPASPASSLDDNENDGRPAAGRGQKMPMLKCILMFILTSYGLLHSLAFFDLLISLEILIKFNYILLTVPVESYFPGSL